MLCVYCEQRWRVSYWLIIARHQHYETPSGARHDVLIINRCLDCFICGFFFLRSLKGNSVFVTTLSIVLSVRWTRWCLLLFICLERLPLFDAFSGTTCGFALLFVLRMFSSMPIIRCFNTLHIQSSLHGASMDWGVKRCAGDFHIHFSDALPCRLIGAFLWSDGQADERVHDRKYFRRVWVNKKTAQWMGKCI